ncbi:Glycosyltransferase, catalytic subunit of cellulose synthase and poly-beta-1,6-N-acetylglucosamine synthase [Pseudarcicella hirudinis]|uniref:Glycosyltransferase, catalytic subunit of cellulose synthase and poly-beta-1,6-N-acetylglucosamine synthase n=1 Tax=Pseudarcicella hirudinis TaxID=1079859 RepID=A0A1I5MHM1_9BACT|nr:glycosyltransferase [Pseudarcicella hirudinis]SFP08817.1 Glycosyltransferase, catalytic subunit of cellulose synthase and poly-beta-1,6-N-acetylglucosamine synthase [Pseudarcicella hirudinis]
MKKFSVVIPVYNRPEEIQELLESLTSQTFQNFEVLIIEDGSINKADKIAAEFATRLDLKYFYKENTGQGFSRNYGFERASGDYFIVFDSDAVIPPKYFETVDKYLTHTPLDAFGGPDAASPDFSPLQKAISYSMTSIFTTGGIRGKKKGVGNFQPRSFNMGISRQTFEKTGGFAKRDMGEDVEFSLRMQSLGLKVGLIEEAFVYHKRRGDFRAFFKQVFSFGRTRILLKKYNPDILKLIHAFPAVFTIGCLLIPVFYLTFKPFFYAGMSILLIYNLLILLDSSLKHKNIYIGFLSLVAVYVQLVGYGLGFLKELLLPSK